MNRVQASFELTQKSFNENPEVLKKLQESDVASQALKLEFDMYCAFQEVKSLAVGMGLISVDEGQTIYIALGNTPEHFNTQPIHVRYVLIHQFQQLMQWKINGAKPPRRKVG